MKQAPAEFGLGCLPAVVVGLFVVFPTALATTIGDCVGEGGGITPCPHRHLDILVVITVGTLVCVALTWLTNRMARASAERGRAPAWGLAAGFGLAGGLVVAYYLVSAGVS